MTAKRPRKVRSYLVSGYQKDALAALRPPENLLVSEWAEQYRMLESKSSAMPGPWKNSKTPYLVGIMDEFLNYGRSPLRTEGMCAHWNTQLRRVYHDYR